MTAGSAEAWRVVLALLLLALVAWAPGLGLLRWLLPRRSRLEALAAAPAVSAGLLYCLGELLSAAHVRTGAGLAVALGVLGAGLLVWRVARGDRARPAPLALTVLLAAVATSSGLWTVGVRHLTAVAPHNDGYNHGFFVRRLAELHTLDPVKVMPHDVVLGGHGVDYYPLALHQEAATLVQVLHLDVAVAWNLTALSLIVVALPVGMLALGRVLFADARFVPEACALVAAVLPSLTYSTTWWGGFALAAGFAATPGALLLAVGAARRWHAGTTVCAALALAGVAGMHTSEYSLLAVVAVVVVLLRASRRPWRAIAGELVRLAVVGVASLLLLAPALAQLHRGLDERAYPVPTEGIGVGRSLQHVVVQFSFVPPVTPTAVVLAFWIGFVACLVRRRALAWAAAWGLFALLYLWLAAFPSHLIASLTATWYSDLFRLGYILAFLSIPFLAFAVAGGLRSPRRELRLAGPVLGLVLVVTSSASAVDAMHQNYRDFSLVGPDERAAFRFLADHVGPDEHVVNQHQDGSAWMYSLNGVAPLAALKTFDFDRPEWRDANYLARHVQDADTDAEVDRLLAFFHARYVYVGPRVFPTEKPGIDRAALARSSALRLVFSRGRAQVYEVVR